MKAKKLQSPAAGQIINITVCMPKKRSLYLLPGKTIAFPPFGGIGFHHFLLESDEK
jgi:hypothetical protein